MDILLLQHSVMTRFESRCQSGLIINRVVCVQWRNARGQRDNAS